MVGMEANFQIATEPPTAITNKPEESKDSDKKNIRKVTWNRKILENKYKDRDNNFLVMFSSSRS